MPEEHNRMNSVDVAIINAVYTTSTRLWKLADKIIPLIRDMECACETIDVSELNPCTYTCNRCEALEEYSNICFGVE